MLRKEEMLRRQMADATVAENEKLQHDLARLQREREEQVRP